MADNIDDILDDVQDIATVGVKASAAEQVNIHQLVNYLRETVPLFLGGSEGELSHILSEPANESLLARYIIYSFDFFFVGTTLFFF